MVVLRSSKEEAASTEVFKIRVTVIRDGLGGGGFLAGSLYVAQETVGVDAVSEHSTPCLVTGRTIAFCREEPVADTPAHSAEEKRGASEFLAAVVRGADEAGIPD